MISTIPVIRDTFFWRQRVALDSEAFLIDFRWNGRGRAWYISLYTEDEVPLVLSIKVVSNRPLLERFKYIQGMPAGEIIAFDPTGKIPYAGYDQLGTDVELLYADSEELNRATSS